MKSITPVQDNQAEVVFMVNDGGKGVSSSKAATVMQNVHADKGKGILKVQVSCWIFSTCVGPMVTVSWSGVWMVSSTSE